MPRLILATSNPGKLKEFQAYLTGNTWELALKPAELEIEETGTTFIENACLKASQVAKALGEWAIADDSGLSVDALGGAPGLYSARYGSSDADRIARLLRELEGQEERTAQFICAIAVARPDGTLALQAEGICPGTITHEVKGVGGFGYDPIFYMPEYGMTYGEMPSGLKHRISHRGKAFDIILPQLKAIDFSVKFEG